MSTPDIGVRGAPAKKRRTKAEEVLRALASIAEPHNPRIIRLERFLDLVERVERLSKTDRLRIVDQALLLLEMNYVHLPLKRAMHAIDPIQQLKLLRFRLSETKPQHQTSAMQFHRRMLAIFASTRDLHTMYLLPAPYRDQVAYLPFLIEQYFGQDHSGKRTEKFLISRVVKDLYKAPGAVPDSPAFERGVEVLFWNGIPIRRAIELNGESQAGSNTEARFARGLDNLTTRPLDTSLPPDELWVDITFRTKSGAIGTHRQEWLVLVSTEAEKLFEPKKHKTKQSKRRREAIDVKKTRINEVKQTMYAPVELEVRKSIASALNAGTRIVDGREFGYIRLFSFDVEEPDQFVKDFADLISSDRIPRDGLIIDVRGNGGGRIRAGERLLQLLTPRTIEPELFQFINTPLNLEICRRAPRDWHLKRWVDSMAEAVATGATYSSGFPLTSVESCNDLGQVYHGPVVLITDALSYSTTDIFAAGFQDNKVGEVLGMSDNTGAGGANVWRYEDLISAIGRHPKSPFQPLPKGADMLVAMRRSIRVGKFAGRPLEELGIMPDRRHYATRRDILGSNEDLIRRAARILMTKPVYSLAVRPLKMRGERAVTLSATTKLPSSDKSAQIARVDVYLDGRPLKSIAAVEGSITSRRLVLGPSGRQKLELRIEAYDKSGNLVAACRKQV